MVELIGHYGGDEEHALSAWTSTRRELTEERQARIPELLRMLAENGHHTPFEKSTLHFVVDLDTASHIHLLKHRIGVSVNGESARYKELVAENWHLPIDWTNKWRELLNQHCKDSFEIYHECLKDLEPALGRKRAKESARYFLPYASQLRFDVTFNFRSFMHFQGLRNKRDAQEEIAAIAEEMLWQVIETEHFPWSLKAFGY